MLTKIATAVSQTVTSQLAPITQELRDHKEATDKSVGSILQAIKDLKTSQNHQLDGLIKSLPKKLLVERLQKAPVGEKNEFIRIQLREKLFIFAEH